MTTSTIIFFLLASSLTAAPRRVVIVVRPHASGAQFAGAVVGNVIGNLIAARQARAQMAQPAETAAPPSTGIWTKFRCEVTLGGEVQIFYDSDCVQSGDTQPSGAFGTWRVCNQAVCAR